MTRQVQVVCCKRHGEPVDVVEVEAWPLPLLKENDVLVEMEAAGINPSDINILQGKYGVLPQLPAIIGNEGVGIVSEVGNPSLKHLLGKQVIAPSRIGHWSEAWIADASEVVVIPSSIPAGQAALLSVNPPTAWLMLHDFVNLAPGDWVIQNSANSAVGRAVIDIANAKEWRTINLVRRDAVVDELLAAGGTIVIVEDQSTSKTIQELLKGAPIKLGLNGVGGESCRQMTRTLCQGASLITYGAMGRQPFTIDNHLLIFKDLICRGFWRKKWFEKAAKSDIDKLFEELIGLAVSGKLKPPIEKMYPLSEARQAVTHASQGARSGKILFRKG